MIVWEWINPMIEFLGNEYLGAESMFDEIKAEHKNSKYKIVVIDWWQFAPWWHYEKDGVSGDVFGGSNTLEIIKKVKEYDICFFMISEYWFQPRWNISSEAINAMIEELDKLNQKIVLFILTNPKITKHRGSFQMDPVSTLTTLSNLTLIIDQKILHLICYWDLKDLIEHYFSNLWAMNHMCTRHISVIKNLDQSLRGI